MSDRGPDRLPVSFVTNGRLSSSSSSLNSGTSGSRSAVSGTNGIPENGALADMLRQRLGLPEGQSIETQVQIFENSIDGTTQSELDYEPDDEVDFDDMDEEIVYADDERADSGTASSATGTTNGKNSTVRSGAECIVKTSATIVVHKKDFPLSTRTSDGAPDDKPDTRSGFLPNDRPSITQVKERDLLLFVPASEFKEPLSKRFEKQNKRVMRRDLTPEQGLLNYLRFKGEDGFSKVFKGPAAAAEAKAKLAQRIGRLQELGLKPTMHDRFLRAAVDDHFDHEGFWREQVALWILKYEWRRREGPEVSRDELDREIEEWMSRRGKFDTTEDMEADLTDFMAGRGFDRNDRQSLDEDMDEYWKKRKGQAELMLPSTDDDTDNTSTVTSLQSGRNSSQYLDFNEQDLDADLQAYLSKRGQANGTSLASETDVDDSVSVNSESGTGGCSAYSSLLVPLNGNRRMTPQERMRHSFARRMNASTSSGNVSADDLDSDLDAYHSRQKTIAARSQEDSVGKKAHEEKKRAEAVVGHGDRFASDTADFDDDIDEELDWQT